MAEWFRLGYFHDKTLMVRRACESNFYPLHDLVTLLGSTPFENVTLQNISVSFDSYFMKYIYILNDSINMIFSSF